MKKVILLCILTLLAGAPCTAASEELSDIRERLKWLNAEAIMLAVEDMKGQPGFDYQGAVEKWKYMSRHLERVRKQLNGKDSLATRKEAEHLLSLQREILLSNPLLNADRILVTRFRLGQRARKVMAPSFCMPPSNYMGLMDTPKTGYDASICELSGLRNDKIDSRTIFKPTANTGIADVQLHWDADRMLFAAPAHVTYPTGEKAYAWRIFEIGIDGKGLRQITETLEPDLEFADPCYLPDGRILFTTNIGYNGIPCENGLRTIHNLALYDPKSRALRKISFDQDGNWSPTVMQNGRIMYTRWEYTDLTHYFSRIVMHSNPDGTECKALYGSGSYWPNSIYDMHELPGQNSRFIGIVTGHHGISHSGRLFIFNPLKGRKEEKGVVQEIPYRKKKTIPEIKDYLVEGVWPQFTRPFPLSDKYFLVSAKLHKKGLWGIYLVDIFDNVTLIAEFEGEGMVTPIPVKKQPLPPVIPDKIHPEDKEATVFIQDLYEGEGLRGVPRGTVKKLRVFTYEYAYLNSPSDFDAQGIQSGWDIKRELGTVEVEKDGSAIFKVPANTPISLQPLDAGGRAIQWMRSWFTPMPGEVVSCIGCHEDQNIIPIPKRVMASQMPPKRLVEPKGGIRPFTFEYEIQPILNRYCIACHDGKENRMYLKEDSMELYKRGVVTKIRRHYHKSYLNLHPFVYRQGPEADMYVLRPYEYHASNSELIRMLEKGHYGVRLEQEDMQTLTKWIDFNAPYSGSFEIWKPYKGYEQYERRQELLKKYGGVAVDWKQELENYAARLKGQGAIQPLQPAREKKYAIPRKAYAWGFDSATAQRMQQADRKETEKVVSIAPGISMTFVWIPKGKLACGTDCGSQGTADYRKVKIGKGFWMGKLEVTNAQYKALCPDHDSRYVGQQWKDHTTPGYPVNQPEQPVVRVSWKEAMEYCRKLSERTGLKAALPSQEQWEWACRAGSVTDMWYGDAAADYSAYENLADRKISQLAVMGVDPKPMPKDYELRKFWDFVPRDRFADDGSLISVKGGLYRPNPWGLCDMHGNVAEWTSSTRSDGKGDPNERVVCGGSWRDRAHTATASYRRYYLSWQAPFNVGFRVILSE